MRNANAFTDYYLCTSESGTIYEPEHEKYATIAKQWRSIGEPEGKWDWLNEEWSALWGADPSLPAFRHHHGFRMIPWQLAIHHASQELRVIAGGYSSGKSLGIIVSILTLAATVDHFKAMCVAPSFFQAQLLYKMAVQIMADTLYEERFLMNSIIAPFPIITIGNSHVRESTIEFKSASDDGESILSWRGDLAMIDQTELIPNVPRLRNNLGSRLVGKAPGGRQYFGTMDWLANAGPSPGFWDLYQTGEHDPESCISITVTSYDNPHNSEADIRRLEREVGGVNSDGSRNQAMIDQWLLAKRPITMGKHFSDATLNRCRDEGLEKIMVKALREGRPGFVKEEDSTGIYRWLMPYEHGRSYLVVGDPGYANRPDRNSSVIFVFDVTDWNNGPAVMRGFCWIDGNASIMPFITAFNGLVDAYRAHGQCAFDATGTQKSYDELAMQIHNLAVEPLSFSRHKFIFLNALKVLLEQGLIKFPYIGGVWDQLANYDLPDTNLRQDIVAALMMVAHWLRERMYDDSSSQEFSAPADQEDDRNAHSVVDRCPAADR